MKFLRFTILAGCFALAGCQNDRQNEQGKFALKFENTLCLPTLNKIPQGSKGMYFHEENDQRYLVIENENTREIHFLNIDNREIENTIKLREDGPDGIPHNFGYTVKSLDSVFVPTDGFRLYLINRKGHVLKKIQFDTLDNGQNLPVRALSRFYSPILFKGDFAYGVQMDGMPHYQSNDPGNYNFCYRFDLSGNTVRLMPISHPKEFWGSRKKEVFFSWDFDGRRFVISPVFSHQIYLSKDLRQIDTAIRVQSRFVHKFRNGDPDRLRSMNFVQFAREALSTQSYLGIAYDPYRQIYYRFFFPGEKGVEVMTDEEVLKTYYSQPSFGVIVLNKDFQVMCETVLTKSVYLQHQFFIAEEGLYLSANHPDNPDVKESQICFHIYNLKSL